MSGREVSVAAVYAAVMTRAEFVAHLQFDGWDADSIEAKANEIYGPAR